MTNKITCPNCNFSEKTDKNTGEEIHTFLCKECDSAFSARIKFKVTIEEFEVLEDDLNE